MSHEGNDEVKEGKIDLLQGDLEAFVMKKDETVQPMHDRLTLLVTDIKTLGSKYWDDCKVTKALFRSQPINPVNAKKMSHRMFGHMHGVLNEVYL